MNYRLQFLFDLAVNQESKKKKGNNLFKWYFSTMNLTMMSEWEGSLGRGFQLRQPSNNFSIRWLRPTLSQWQSEWGEMGVQGGHAPLGATRPGWQGWRRPPGELTKDPNAGDSEINDETGGWLAWRRWRFGCHCWSEGTAWPLCRKVQGGAPEETGQVGLPLTTDATRTEKLPGSVHNPAQGQPRTPRATCEFAVHTQSMAICQTAVWSIRHVYQAACCLCSYFRSLPYFPK